MKNKLLENFTIKRKTIRYRITRLVLIVLFISMGITTSLSIILSLKSSKSMLIENLDNAIENTELVLKNFESSLSQEIQNILNTGFIQEEIISNEKEKTLKIIKSLKQTNENIISVYIKDIKNNVLFDPFEYKSKKDIPNDIFSDSNNKESLFIGPYKNNDDINIYTLYMPIKENNNIVGVLCIDIDSKEIILLTHNCTFGKKTGSIILLNKDNVVISDSANIVGLNSKVDVSKYINNSEKYLISNNIKYSYKFQESKINEWKYIAVINHTEYYNLFYLSIIVSTISFIILFIISIFSSLYFSKKITKNLYIFKEYFKELGKGNFNKKITNTSNDEFEYLFKDYNETVKNIGELFKGVSDFSRDISKNLEDVKTSYSELVKSTEYICGSMEDITSKSENQNFESKEIMNNIEDLSNSIENISLSLKNINNLCEISKENSLLGKDEMIILVESSKETKETSTIVSNNIIEMSNNYKDIEIILNAILEISKQTHLLSLNASIEAAKAGDAGKGFSVVAKEINILSDRTKEATTNISNIIKKINNSTKNTTTNINKVINAIEIQNKKIYKTNKVFEDIYNSITNLSLNIESIKDLNNHMLNYKNLISNSMKKLSENLEESFSYVEGVNATTEEQLAIMIELNNITNEINNMSNLLEDEINKFNY